MNGLKCFESEIDLQKRDGRIQSTMDHISKYFIEQINIYPLSFIACFILAESSATHISNYYFLEPEYEWCYKKEECAEETWKAQFPVSCNYSSN